MDHLIRLLKEVDANSEHYMVHLECDRRRQYNVTHPVIRDILDYATEFLTTGPNVGYPVYPGEVDRFGWLTAYFQMKRGILLFG